MIGFSYETSLQSEDSIITDIDINNNFDRHRESCVGYSEFYNERLPQKQNELIHECYNDKHQHLIGPAKIKHVKIHLNDPYKDIENDLA